MYRWNNLFLLTIEKNQQFNVLETVHSGSNKKRQCTYIFILYVPVLYQDMLLQMRWLVEQYECFICFLTGLRLREILSTKHFFSINSINHLFSRWFNASRPSCMVLESFILFMQRYNTQSSVIKGHYMKFWICNYTWLNITRAVRCFFSARFWA